MIKVLLFANLRELAGTNQLEIDSSNVHSVRELILRLNEIHPALEQVLDDESAMISINQKYAAWEAVLADGDEVGILPPVSGG